MPNHCDADLAIDGPADQLGEFLAKYVTKCDGAVLNLNAIRPYPAHLAELDRIAHEWDEQHPDGKPWGERPKDGFNSGGYEWCIEEWGTKWGCYQTHGCDAPLEKTESGVVLHFSTAWGPFRLALLEEVSARFTALTFQYDYYERGAGFQGHVAVTGGRVVSNEQGEYYGERGG